MMIVFVVSRSTSSRELSEVRSRDSSE